MRASPALRGIYNAILSLHIFKPPSKNKTNILSKLATISIILVMIGGCSTNHIKQQSHISQQHSQSKKLLSNVGVPVIAQINKPPSKKKIFHGTSISTNQSNLPKKYQNDHLIRYVSANPVLLTECLTKLSSLTSIPHVLLVGSDSIPLNLNTKEAQTQLATYGINQTIKMDFNKSFPEILDLLAKQFDLSWRFENNRIEFKQFLTGNYQLAALPSQSTFSNSIGNSNSAGSINLPLEIESTLEMLAGNNANISFGDASGILTVIARPSAHRRIEKYVHELNSFLNQQIALDVNVLSITHRHTEEVSVGLDIFAGSKTNDFLKWSTNQRKIQGGQVNVGILSGDVDLDLLMTALDQHGEVTVETRTGASTSNNQVVPIQVINQTAYAKSIQTLSGSNGEAGVTIEPGTLTTGFEMQLLPRILPTGDILLRYNVKLSDLNDLEEFTSDRQTIQLPRLSTTSFEQQAILGNNEVLVLMGFERNRRSLDRPGKGILAALSGIQKSNEMDRISTVLTIQPRITPPQH